jgi:hypothetical protein
MVWNMGNADVVRAAPAGEMCAAYRGWTGAGAGGPKVTLVVVVGTIVTFEPGTRGSTRWTMWGVTTM